MTAFVPHTLPEQIALITAEAEGRKVFIVVGAESGGRCEKTGDWWNFRCYRYEVEQPLMEGWANVYGPNAAQLHATEEQARKCANADAKRVAVHMREVRATQGPTP